MPSSQQHAWEHLLKPTPTVDGPPMSAEEKKDTAAFRRAMTLFEKRQGRDALISVMKIELMNRGEQRWRVDALAPRPGENGQSSLLDSGR